MEHLLFNGYYFGGGIIKCIIKKKKKYCILVPSASFNVFESSFLKGKKFKVVTSSLYISLAEAQRAIVY